MAAAGRGGPTSAGPSVVRRRGRSLPRRTRAFPGGEPGARSRRRSPCPPSAAAGPPLPGERGRRPTSPPCPPPAGAPALRLGAVIRRHDARRWAPRTVSAVATRRRAVGPPGPAGSPESSVVAAGGHESRRAHPAPSEGPESSSAHRVAADSEGPGGPPLPGARGRRRAQSSRWPEAVVAAVGRSGPAGGAQPSTGCGPVRSEPQALIVLK